MEFVKVMEIVKNKRKIASKKRIQKNINECGICFDNISKTTLECGHKMCVQCCIKHFRKNENCPFCRKSICPHDNRLKEIDDAIEIEMNTEYMFEDYNKEMDMYEYLKFKGIQEKDAEEIVETFRDSIHEICDTLQNYTDELSDVSDSECEHITYEEIPEYIETTVEEIDVRITITTE